MELFVMQFPLTACYTPSETQRMSLLLCCQTTL